LDRFLVQSHHLNRRFQRNNDGVSKATMTRLAAAFAKSHPALVTFITAGDGDTAANLDALVAGGADVIELGMPFTDPMADGPAIQAANLRSLAAGTTTADIFAIAAAFCARHSDVPLVLMGYANPMTLRGADWFASECNKAGVDGVICVDIPPEEDAELGPTLRSAGSSASPHPPPTLRGYPPCSMAHRASSIMSALPGSPANNKLHRPASKKQSRG
jgi:tryptophan synthase alpha subunit